MRSGVKRMLSLMPTRCVRLACFGSPGDAPVVLLLRRPAPAFAAVRAPRHGPQVGRRRAARLRQQQAGRLLISMAFAFLRGLTAAPGAHLGAGGLRAPSLCGWPGRARPSVPSAARRSIRRPRVPGGCLYQPGSRVVAARLALAHLDDAEHAAHLRRAERALAGHHRQRCCRAAASPSRSCRPCRARPSPCSRGSAAVICCATPRWSTPIIVGTSWPIAFIVWWLLWQWKAQSPSSSARNSICAHLAHRDVGRDLGPARALRRRRRRRCR